MNMKLMMDNKWRFEHAKVSMTEPGHNESDSTMDLRYNEVPV